jgi:hypothetical protein
MSYLLQNHREASPEVLARHKAEVLRQIDCRLSRLRHNEDLRNGPATQLDLEDELNRVWKHIRPRPTHKTSSPFEGGASWIGEPFDELQRAAVLDLLLTLTEHVPWRVDYTKWFEAVAEPAEEERLRRTTDPLT